MKRAIARLSVIALLALATMAHAADIKKHAADIKKGEELVNKGGCIACHGVGLNKPVTPNYPKLAGQYQSYLFHALQQYQNKHQNALYGRNNAVMGGMVAQYSTQDLQDISGYIAGLKGDLYLRNDKH